MELKKKFVSATHDFSSYEKRVNAPYLRRAFDLDFAPAKADIKIAGLGFYRIWVNGREITRGHMSPYISNPDHFIYYDVYDLTELLAVGKNVIGVQLGNGFLNEFAGVPYQFDLADFRSAPKLAVAFEAVDDSGNKLTFEADSQFKCHPSPITYDSIRVGEMYDANLEIGGWNLPDFDDSEWTDAHWCESPRGQLTECTVSPIVTEFELAPVDIRWAKVGVMPILWDRLKDVHVPEDMNREGYLYDFGLNRAGIFRLRIKGKKGQKVVLQFCEQLDANGDLDLAPMSASPYGYSQRSEYTCKGDGIEEYTPSFTYFGYQYCLVMGITEEQATPDLLTYVVMNTKLERAGDFKCSDERINKLQEATINSDLANFFHIPTDCPTREKNGWLGDACFSIEQYLYNFDCIDNFKEWFKGINYCQSPEGIFHATVPAGTDWSYGQGPSTDSSAVMMPYQMWRYTGDKQILINSANTILRYLNYITTEVGEDGLMHSGLGDWCHVAREAYLFKAPRIFTNSAIFLETARLAVRIYDEIGWMPHKHFAEEIFNNMRTAIRNRLVDFGTMTVAGRCQTAQAMAIAYGVFDKGEEQAAFNALVDMIEESNEFMDIGTLGIRVLFDVLADHGRSDLALKLIMREEFPSFGWLIDQGATTLREDLRTGATTNGSKNHHFMGHVSAWFYKNLAGIKINPNHLSADEINIQPRFLDGIDYVTAHYDAKPGRVAVDWKRDGDEILFRLDYPEDAIGFFMLDKGWQFEDGKRFTDAKSGEYRILPTTRNDNVTDKGAFGR